VNDIFIFYSAFSEDLGFVASYAMETAVLRASIIAWLGMPDLQAPQPFAKVSVPYWAKKHNATKMVS
jgi:hypothetical protein